MKLGKSFTLISALLCVFAHWSPGVAAMRNNQKSKAASTVGSEIEIDRIDLKGITVFPNSAIEAALEVSPGDRLERLKIIRTEQNLQNLYRLHGYEEVRIQSRLVRKKNENKSFETSLEFEIVEGRPTRISEIQVIHEDEDATAQKSWVDREAKVRAAIKLKSGDIYDEEKVAQVKRSVQELLATEEYIGAKIEATVTRTQAPSQSQEKPLPVAFWQKLEFKISLGDRVSFGFRGNSFFTLGYLDSLVDEMRLVGLGKDYVTAVKNRIEEEYHSAGFARVEISPLTFEKQKKFERKVTYSIREGPRVKIESIAFDGNSVYDDETLKKEFFSKASTLVQHEFYIEKDVQKAADLLIEWLKEKGYLSAKVVTIHATYPPKPKTKQPDSTVRLLIYLYEGDQTLVQGVSVQGATVFDRDQIKKVLKVQEGDPLNLFSLSEGIEVLKRSYRNQGYLGFKISNEGTETLIQYSEENRLANIFLQIEEGPKYKVSQIEIEGLEKTEENVVKRELLFKENEVLKEDLITGSERQIRRLGIFAGVTIRTFDDPGQPDAKIVRISLQEADRGILVVGPGYRNDLGIRAFGQLGYTNLWGQNHTVSINLAGNRRFYKYNFIEGQAQLSYAWPWFVLPGLNFRPAIAIAKTQYNNFAADTLSLSLGWDKQLIAQPNLIAGFTYTLERINQFNSDLNSGQLRVGTITPKLSIDLRDSPVAPTSGFFASASFDYASPSLYSQSDPFPISYYRIQFRSDYYVPVTKDIIWYLSFRTGFEQNLAHTLDSSASNPDPNQDSIPFIKQFAIGGVGSLRGYQEQEINYQTSGSSIRGSLSYVNYRTQLDLPFAGALRFDVFLDAANLLVDNFSFGGVTYAPGFGFRYQTPVGPISLDCGFKVNPPKGVSSDAYVIHFSVGII